MTFTPVTPGEMRNGSTIVDDLVMRFGEMPIAFANSGTAHTQLRILLLAADTALRLSLYFGNSPEFWMNLQSHYDLKMARNDRRYKANKSTAGCLSYNLSGIPEPTYLAAVCTCA